MYEWFKREGRREGGEVQQEQVRRKKLPGGRIRNENAAVIWKKKETSRGNIKR